MAKKRYIIVSLIICGMFNNYSIRTVISVAIVAMTEIRTIVHPDGTITTEQDFNWDSKQKGLLLSSFFYGYISSQIISGYISFKFGGHLIYGLGLGIASLLTVLTPIIAPFGIQYLIAIRIFEGICEGAAYTSIYGVYNKWIPPNERSTVLSMGISGATIGIISSMLLGGILGQQFGWKSIFYIFGAIGLIWYILWVMIVRESPAKDKFISEDEKRYITESLAYSIEERLPVPWKSILKTRPILIVSLCTLTDSWGTYLFLTGLPTYLNDVMNYNVQNSGILSALPYICSAVSTPFLGMFADFLETKMEVPKIKIRRGYICISFILQAIFSIILSFILNPAGSIICVSITVVFGAMGFSGILVQPLDFAPKFATVIFAIQNTVGTLSGILAPTITGFVVQNGTANEWGIVFYIYAAILAVAAPLYFFFGSAERQPWADGIKKDEKKDAQ